MINLSGYFKLKTLIYLHNRGYSLLRNSELEANRNYYKKVFLEFKSKSTHNRIDSIVFSKDRAMQLHAFLRSFSEMVENPGKIIILFKTSNDFHKKSYDELKRIFSGKDFIFIEESDFRSQLIEICNNSYAKIIGLFVDDMIFVQKINYSHLLEFETLENVVSLGRGKDFDFSIVLNKPIKLPDFIPADNGYLKFKWDQVKEYSDWSYPLGVSGYFYSNSELNVMLNNINFKAPNSLENNLQYFKPFFIHRFGIFYNEMACVGIHANIVQSEGFNPIIGTHGVEDLLQLWEEGLMIDLNKCYKIKNASAQTQVFEFIKRK